MLRYSHSVFVFDLDDTLYPEKDYFNSGLRFVGGVIEKLYGIDGNSLIDECLQSQCEDIWGAVCAKLGLPPEVKESFLWLYRLHMPDIKVKEQVLDVLTEVKRKSAGLAILTDGRSVTQRLKVASLGLSDFPLFISEEWGEEKPGILRYAKINDMYKGFTCVYVGDNPRKDFYAPNLLGWTTFCLRDHGNNIHPQETTSLEPEYLPQIWLDNLVDLRKYVC